MELDRKTITCGGVIALAFAVVGLFVGWLVGSSQTAVVGTLLPLVFGLLGALSWQSLAHAIHAEKAVDVLKSHLTEETANDLADRIRGQTSLLALGTFWAAVTVLFCLTCFAGIKRGIAERVPSYPTAVEMLANTKLTATDHLYANKIRWHLMNAGVGRNDAISFFANVVAPEIERGNKTTGSPDTIMIDGKLVRAPTPIESVWMALNSTPDLSLRGSVVAEQHDDDPTANPHRPTTT